MRTMSQTDTASAWTALQEFDDTLKSLLTAAARGDVAFDRSWTFRRDDETPDVMVEITRLASRTDPPAPRNDHALEMNEAAFEAKLSQLFRRAHRDGVGLDRSWTVRCEDGPDLMVEVTRLAKPETTECSQ